MSTRDAIVVPDTLTALYRQRSGAEGLAWTDGLPLLAERLLRHWRLEPDGQLRHGMVALVLPVVRADGTPAALKLQPVDEENRWEPVGLRAWRGDGVVRLLEDDPATGSILLERLNGGLSLSTVDIDDAVGTLAELLARLVAVPAPSGLRRLSDIATGMLDDTQGTIAALADPSDRLLVGTCASSVAELIGEPGNQLLHWDLHYENVLAGQREPWLAIDPKPLAGDPGFEILPALHNRWEEAVATGNPERAVLRRFDRLTEALGIDRARAVGWTLGRVLQNTIWDVEDGASHMARVQAAIAHMLLGHRS